MVDVTQNLVSKPFVFLETYRAAGNYWELKQKDNPSGVHRRIQIWNKSGLCGAIYSDLGNAYYKAGDHAQAISCFTKAIELNPNFADAYSNRGIAYSESGQLANALSDYTKAIELNPKFADTYFSRAVVNALMGRTAEAKKDLQRSGGVEPGLETAGREGIRPTQIGAVTPARRWATRSSHGAGWHCGSVPLALPVLALRSKLPRFNPAPPG